MEECYALLGLLPTATPEEIEEAYKNKKRALAASEEGQVSVMEKALEKAYNDAIMATFAPIRPFAVPSPSGPGSDMPYLTRSTYTAPSRQSPSADPSLQKLVGDVSVRFSDEQLLNMDIGELRERYMPQKKESAFFTLGIRDRLLRFYARAYLAFAFFDLLMRLAVGAAWVGILNALQSVPALKEAAAGAPPSVFISITTSFVSTAYLFCCSLPMPIVTRFFIWGRPAEKGTTYWMLCFLSLTVSFILYSLTGFLFRFLPAEWGGSGVSLMFVSLALCVATLRYEGS